VRACTVEDGDGVKRYYYIPGTDTCVAVYGCARAESHYVNGDVALLFDGTSNSDFNHWTTRARGALILDARTQTDFGSIRTYVEFLLTIGPDDFVVNYNDTDIGRDEAYIEITGGRGTFTAGLADSFFDFFSSDTFSTRIDVDDPTEESTLFAYSLDATDAWTGTLSFEDPASSGRRLNGTDDYEGQKAPDVIGAIKYDKGNVSAQIMAMARWINDDYGDGLGWAAGAGLAISDIASVFGFATQATYAEGAIGYVTTIPAASATSKGRAETTPTAPGACARDSPRTSPPACRAGWTAPSPMSRATAAATNTTSGPS
jgi:hypothetical protein